MLRNHGRKDKYLHEKVGFNLRFNEIQAAVGREQLKVLDQLNAGRRRAAEWYRRELAGVKGVTLPPADTDGKTRDRVYHMFVIRLGTTTFASRSPEHLRIRGSRPASTIPCPTIFSRRSLICMGRSRCCRELRIM